MSNANDSLRDPIKRARGLGSAKHGVHHFMIQRITALALIILGIWFLVLTLGLLNADYWQAHATLARPYNALLMIAFIVAMFWHAQLGLQVVIEDYVHTPRLQITLQIAVKFLCFIAGLASVLAVLRIALGS
ncbi:MAG: succinate dehydrogenase, hydrophobic membrane anchor protein [Xanthomonadales bacterium]|nr:succinate dehydrogenase, hydrophobic membrane anchor protein [Xanthomonadales bacterium]